MLHLFKILATVIFLFGSLALSTLAGALAARVTRNLTRWCLLTLALCVLLNVPYMLAANPILHVLNAAEGEPLNWQVVKDATLPFAGYGAALGVLGFLVVVRNAPRFFQREP